MYVPGIILAIIRGCKRGLNATPCKDSGWAKYIRFVCFREYIVIIVFNHSNLNGLKKHKAPAELASALCPSIIVMLDFAKNMQMAGQPCFKKQDNR